MKFPKDSLVFCKADNFIGKVLTYSNYHKEYILESLKNKEPYFYLEDELELLEIDPNNVDSYIKIISRLNSN